jgi:hypothetical protein
MRDSDLHRTTPSALRNPGFIFGLDFSLRLHPCLSASKKVRSRGGFETRPYPLKFGVKGDKALFLTLGTFLSVFICVPLGFFIPHSEFHIPNSERGFGVYFFIPQSEIHNPQSKGGFYGQKGTANETL